MKFSNVTSTAGEWLRGEGPHHQIVISSRVRLARNLRDRAFPGWAKKAERTAILELVKARVEGLPEMQDAFSEVVAGAFPAGETSPGRAASDQPRARGQGSRQRRRDEPAPDTERDD